MQREQDLIIAAPTSAVPQRIPDAGCQSGAHCNKTGFWLSPLDPLVKTRARVFLAFVIISNSNASCTVTGCCPLLRFSQIEASIRFARAKNSRNCAARTSTSLFEKLIFRAVGGYWSMV